MRIDAVTIFPDYFDALNLSLLGKAREKNLIQFDAHDLRDWTFDKHKTVDDSPYGGGAGMLMKPEPWGLAFDDLLDADGETIVIFTNPAGEVFKQATAQELASAKHIVFACGRYEGIDQRVIDYANTKAKVRLLSIGDYILNGGEVAAIAMIESIARLIPGVIGNAESLAEDEVIAFNAGNHTETIKLSYKDFERLVHPRVFRFSQKTVSLPYDPSDRWVDDY